LQQAGGPSVQVAATGAGDIESQPLTSNRLGHARRGFVLTKISGIQARRDDVLMTAGA
jgi:hypothetical protein